MGWLKQMCDSIYLPVWDIVSALSQVSNLGSCFLFRKFAAVSAKNKQTTTKKKIKTIPRAFEIFSDKAVAHLDWTRESSQFKRGRQAMDTEIRKSKKMPHNWWFIVPIVAFIPWYGMLISMLVCWAAQGKPMYWFQHGPRESPIYISDIGATNLRPLFISCAGLEGLG